MSGPAAAASAKPRRSRRLALWLAALFVLVLAGFLLLRWALQPERLGALLLARAAEATGLELAVSRPATLGIWPSLQLELIDLTAGMPGDASDLLRADRIAVGLPLAVLWSDTDVEFGELRLLRPVLDLDALQRWLSRDDAGDATAPPRLPPYAFSIDARDGRLQADSWAITIATLEATPLRDRQPFSLATDITLLRDDSDPLPLLLQAAMRPVHTPDGITIDDIQAGIGADAAQPALQLAGSLGIEPPALTARLSMRLGDGWPGRWPPLPAELANRLPGRSFDVDYAGSPDLGGRLQVASPADAAEPVRIDLVPSRLIAWLQQPQPKSPLPPADIEFGSERVDTNGVQIQGLRIELRERPATDD